MPPRPSDRASVAAHKRLARSFSVPRKASYFTLIQCTTIASATSSLSGQTGQCVYIICARLLSYSVSASGLSGDVNGAHFHFAVDGAAGSGEIVFAITDMIVNDGDGGATADGTWPLTAVDLVNLRLDYIYVNFHTEANPAGEIRGNLIPAS